MAMGNHCTPSTHRKRLRLHLRRLGLLRPQNRQQSSQTPDIKMLVTAGDAPLTHISLKRGPPDAPHQPIRSDPSQKHTNRTGAGPTEVLTPNFIFATRETDPQMHVGIHWIRCGDGSQLSAIVSAGDCRFLAATFGAAG